MTLGIKVCGCTSAEDARAAVDEGATAIGMILAPGTARTVSMEQAADIVAAVPDTVDRVAVVRDPSPEELTALLAAVPVNRVQFHGKESPELARSLTVGVSRALTFGDSTVDQTIAAWQALDADVTFLLDLPKGGPASDRNAFLDWAADLSVARMALLAGGLSAGNVIEALERVQPAGVDVARGVESAPGIKDLARLHAFVAAVRRYDARRKEDA